MTRESVEPTAQNIQDRSVAYIASILDVPPTEVNPELAFDDLGLDSATAVAMVMDLEEFLGIELEPELLFEHTSVAALSRHLAGEVARTRSAEETAKAGIAP